MALFIFLIDYSFHIHTCMYACIVRVYDGLVSRYVCYLIAKRANSFLAFHETFTLFLQAMITRRFWKTLTPMLLHWFEPNSKTLPERRNNTASLLIYTQYACGFTTIHRRATKSSVKSLLSHLREVSADIYNVSFIRWVIFCRISGNLFFGDDMKSTCINYLYVSLYNGH